MAEENVNVTETNDVPSSDGVAPETNGIPENNGAPTDNGNAQPQLSKKELKKICMQEELYYDDMSKQEMLDMLEAFL